MNFFNAMLNMKKISLTPEKIVIVILAGLTLALVVSIVFLAWVPPVSRDALTHHLAVLKIYLQQGGITELPDIPFSYYPMNLDLLYMVPLYFGNDILPKYIHFLFALFTAGLLFWFLKRRLSVPYALFGALFFLSMPIIVKLSITVYVDLGLIFFSSAALILLLIWTESMHKSKYLILSAICCGLALGTKYNGLIVLFLLTLFIPFLYLKTERGKQYVQSKAFGFAGLYVL
ncbi:MAG: phospholipid carrier-dependent glycosyltransferase, partial [Desulfobacterales bacterium]